MAVQTVPFGLFEVIFKFNKNYKKCAYTYRNDYDDKNNDKTLKRDKGATDKRLT